jgi:hemolysin activation/secretion protein
VAYGSASNGGFKETGRDRVIAELSHADLWGLDHQVDLALTTSLENPHAVRQIGLGCCILAYSRLGVWQICAAYSTVKDDFGDFNTADVSRT